MLNKGDMVRFVRRGHIGETLDRYGSPGQIARVEKSHPHYSEVSLKLISPRHDQSKSAFYTMTDRVEKL